MKQLSILFLLAIFSTNLIGQIHWNKSPHNPVMHAGSSDEQNTKIICPGTVIYQDSIYHMWSFSGDWIDRRFAIGYASSPNEIYWTKDSLNNQVLIPLLAVEEYVRLREIILI